MYDNVETTAYTLRQAIVDEIISNKNHYESFAESKQLENIDIYRQLGRFEGQAGDLFVSAAASVLAIPISVVTARSNLKVIVQEPRDQVLCCKPLFIGYDHSGPGHYSAAILKKSTQQETAEKDVGDQSGQKLPNKGCRCGRSTKKADDKKFCTSTRCPCNKQDVGCSVQCECVACNNPHGSIPTLKKVSGQSRRRRSCHSSFHRVKGSQFLIAKGETLSTGGWSDTETVVLYKILQLNSKRNKRFPTSAQSTILYNKMVAGLKSNSSMRLLRTKTVIQVQQKINYIMKKGGLFQELAKLPF